MNDRKRRGEILRTDTVQKAVFWAFIASLSIIMVSVLFLSLIQPSDSIVGRIRSELCVMAVKGLLSHDTN